MFSLIFVMTLFSIFNFNESTYPIYYCQNKQYTYVNLKPNEITFVESSPFTNYSDGIGDFCAFTFYLEPSSKSTRFIFPLTNPVSPQAFLVIENQTTIDWVDVQNLPPSVSEFQGFVIHDEMDDDVCFLESIIENMPFNFSNEFQILYIRSSIFEVTERNRTCKWQFLAPEGYGFKILIAEWNISSDITLTVFNSSNYQIVNQHSAKMYKPYYNIDNHLTILLSNSNYSFSPKIEFGASISIVRKNVEPVIANCTVMQYTDDTDIWTNIFEYVYANNAFCTYELEILPNTMVIAGDMYGAVMEKNIDIVTYFDEFSETFIHFKFENDPYHLFYRAFLPYHNGTSRKILWKFSSDGSIRIGGFAIQFGTISCFCNDLYWTVSCDEYSYLYYITNTTYSEFSPYSSYYCGNLRCNFTIYSNHLCLNKFILITVTFDKNPTQTNDKFRVISDNTTVFHINSYNRMLGHFSSFVNPNSTNFFEAITDEFDSSYAGLMFVTLMAIEAPRIIQEKIVLTYRKSHHILDISVFSENDILGVEIENTVLFENAYIEIYSASAPENIFFFADETLTKMLQFDNEYNEWHVVKNFRSSVSASSVFYCKATVKKLYIWFSEIDQNFLLFLIAPKELIGGCLLHPNVFILQPLVYYDDRVNLNPFSGVAGSHGTCKTFFLKLAFREEMHTFWPKIWTSAEKSNVKVFTGIQNETLLFEFNKNDADKWQKIVLKSYFYYFEIPFNSSIQIWADESYADPNIIEPHEYFTIVQTPYNLFLEDIRENFATFSIPENLFVTFTFTYYNVTPSMIFEFYAENEIQNVTKAGDILIFTNTTVMLFYKEAIPGSDDLSHDPGVIILLEVKLTNETFTSVKSTPQTTSISTTTDTRVRSYSTPNPKNISYSFIFIFCCIVFILLSCVFLCQRR